MINKEIGVNFSKEARITMAFVLAFVGSGMRGADVVEAGGVSFDCGENFDPRDIASSLEGMDVVQKSSRLNADGKSMGTTIWYGEAVSDSAVAASWAACYDEWFQGNASE